ncbi:hypothetical protein E4T56_gene2279 [Termitomyces sp. T112]|nr:hypothetical protein E4T56_gene2279 [Termitomyces sp. T112]
MNEIVFLRAHNRMLEEELADIKQERNAFQEELSYYRDKAAKDLERTQKLAKMTEVFGNMFKSSEALKDPHVHEEIIDIPDSLSMSDSQKRLVSPGTQHSVQGAIDIAEELHNTGISIFDGVQAKTFSSVSPSNQRRMEPTEDLKRSSATAQLQHQSDLPAKRPRTQSLVLSHSMDEPRHATNVTLSPEIPRYSHIATVQSPEFRDQEGVLHQATSIITETSSPVSSSSKTTDSHKRLPIVFKPSPQPDPAPQQSPTGLLDYKKPRDCPDVPVPHTRPSTEISLSQFRRRNPFQIDPFPKWTSNCEVITSSAVRRLLGGLTGPGATFTQAKEGRTHLFLQPDNCPSLPLPGEPSVVYVGFPKEVNPDVRVFIQRSLRKGEGTVWEYGGEYECILKLLNPRDFKKESIRFREDFVQKLLFEKEFRSRYHTIQQPSTSKRDAELRAIDNGDRTVYVALIECYNYDHEFTSDLVRRCTELSSSSKSHKH